ncbi:MAG: TIM barrel protein, partial [Planctomycetota bacterium]
MTALPFRFANECYTWFMKDAGAAHANRLDHMIEITAKAGFAGIEPIFGWMGELSDPDRLADKLAEHEVEFAALAMGFEWNHPEETDDERRQADEACALLERFPEAMLCTVQRPTSRDDLQARRQNLVANVNAVSRRATDRGIVCSFHPNSPPTSIIRTLEDYEVVLEGLDAQATGWTPDVGHIANGGMDPLETMKR